MANAWNAGSAVLLDQAGFEAIGTTSAGMAYAHAVPDSSGEFGFDTAIEETREIAAAVHIPVSMDGENAYADTLQAVSGNMQRIAGQSHIWPGASGSQTDAGSGQLRIFESANCGRRTVQAVCKRLTIGNWKIG